MRQAVQQVFTDRQAFRDILVMPDGQTFGQVMADFQRSTFAGLDTHRHAWIERSRGASKSSDMAAEACVELFLGPRGGRLFAVACDLEQSAIMHELATGFLQRTSGLGRAVRIEKHRILLPAHDSVLTILSADAPSAYGLLPTWILCDEVAQWPERGDDLWTALWSAVPKRSAKVRCITTPGWSMDSLAWRIRTLALESPQWFVPEPQGPAPWIPASEIEAQRKSLPAHTFRRLFECQWTPSEGAFLSGQEVEAVFTEDLPNATGPVVLAVDLGLTRDACVCAQVRGDQTTGLVVVEALHVWQARNGGKVDLREVREDVMVLARRTNAPVIADRWQAELLLQDLQTAGVQTMEYQATGEGRRRVFQALLDAIRGARLRARPHPILKRELLGLQVKEGPSGWRVDHSGSGHDDYAFAVALGVSEVAARGMSDAPILAGFQQREPGTPWVSAAESGYFPTYGSELEHEENKRNPW